MPYEGEGFWQWLKRRQLEVGSKARSPEDFKQATRDLLTPSTFNGWVMFNTVICIIGLSLLLYLTQYNYFIFSVLSSIPLFYWFLVLHEVCHASTAKALGYDFKFNYGSTAVVSVLHERDSKWKKDSKKIAYAPYVFIIPMSIFFIATGYTYNFIGLIITGFTLIVTHIVFAYGDMQAVK